MLKIRGLHKSFGQIQVIQGMTFTVDPGQRHAIIGPNGAGKTTLFNLITGKYKPQQGQILFNGKDVTGFSPHRLNRLGLARSFQITNVFPGLSVLENVRSGVLSRHGIRFNLGLNVDSRKAINEESLKLLKTIGLADKKDQLAGELAYGEQRALEIGLTLGSEPQLILLDEPTAGMSVDETRETVKLINEITRGKTLLIIEHDMEVVFALADAITVIHYGKVLASGPSESIRVDPKVKEAYLGTSG
jgi:branched-chain amino acid transport system ATP-binding protein